MDMDADTRRARAAAHERELEARYTAFTMRDLAVRWGCSVESVRQIPADRLPYVVIGGGLRREHRRYLPDAVAAYERGRAAAA